MDTAEFWPTPPAFCKDFFPADANEESPIEDVFIDLPSLKQYNYSTQHWPVGKFSTQNALGSLLFENSDESVGSLSTVDASEPTPTSSLGVARDETSEADFAFYLSPQPICTLDFDDAITTPISKLNDRETIALSHQSVQDEDQSTEMHSVAVNTADACLSSKCDSLVMSEQENANVVAESWTSAMNMSGDRAVNGLAEVVESSLHEVNVHGEVLVQDGLDPQCYDTWMGDDQILGDSAALDCLEPNSNHFDPLHGIFLAPYMAPEANFVLMPEASAGDLSPPAYKGVERCAWSVMYKAFVPMLYQSIGGMMEFGPFDDPLVAAKVHDVAILLNAFYNYNDAEFGNVPDLILNFPKSYYGHTVAEAAADKTQDEAYLELMSLGETVAEKKTSRFFGVSKIKNMFEARIPLDEDVMRMP